jgi:hypothetical protein
MPNGNPVNGNKMNGRIVPTEFTKPGVIKTEIDKLTGAYKETQNTSVIKKSMLDELDKALTKLEGCVQYVQNCNCHVVTTCQMMKCQIHAKDMVRQDWNSCQSVSSYVDYPSCQQLTCQYTTCQTVVCQQGMSCQICQTCEVCQLCETCESQCLCQTCQSCQEATYEKWSCQSQACQSCETCQTMVCENITCQAYKDDGKELEQ